MGSIAFDCTWCGRGYEVAPEMAGKAFHCRNCGGEMPVPGRPSAEAATIQLSPQAPTVQLGPPPAAGPRPLAGAHVPPEPAAEEAFCPQCGEPIKRAAVKCRHCGASWGGHPRRTRGDGDLSSAATISLVCGILAFLLCGLVGIGAIIKGNEARRLAKEQDVPVPVTALIGLALGWGGVALITLFLSMTVLGLVLPLFL